MSDGLEAVASAPAWTEADLSGSVADRFYAVARAIPDRVAVTDTSSTTLTYHELAGASRVVASDVLAPWGPRGNVALLSDLSVGTIAGMLGIVAAGAAYVPVDSTEPAARVAEKVAASGADVIVLTPGLEGLAGDIAPGCRQVIVDVAASPTAAADLPVVGPTDPFNIIYTSGSTGRPKGVVQVHRNVLFDTSASNSLFPVGVEDRFGLVIPLTFGASVSDVMGALLNGARLDLFDVKALGVEAMADWMEEREITVTHLVPTVLRRWLSGVEGSGRYPAMRLIKAGGEPLFRSDLELFGSRFDSGRLRNGLGTTETYLVAAAFYDPGDRVDSSIVPIGEAAPGRKVTVVGEDGGEVAPGEVGEIHVRSAYLSPGYWNDPDATATSYIDHDDGSGERTYRTGDLGRIQGDGGLEYLGRVDDMVKVAGQRVHLTDVETVISALEGVREASVVAALDESGDTRLLAYVVAGEGFAGPTRARSLLSGRIPAHMVPARLVVLESLPTLPFGKVDRRALALRDDRADSPAVEYREPRNEVESALALAAAAALGIDRVGIDDDLFSLGMDSLSAVQIVARARGALGVGLAVDAIFENPTISSLAAALADDTVDVAGDLESLLAEVEEIGEPGARSIIDTGRR